MGRTEYEYIKGTAATKKSRKIEPRRIPSKEKTRIRKKNLEKKLKQDKRNNRRYVVSFALTILFCGSMTILGDSRVYEMQKQVRDLDKQINDLKENNEALKVTILKFSSLENIEENARDSLSMVVPSKDDVIDIKDSENYFEQIDDK